MVDTNFKKLQVWKKSSDLVQYTYVITSRFPDSEKFGLISQMRRSSVSIAANIAEGDQRKTIRENLQFLFVAKGSASELQSHVMVAYRIGFIDNSVFQTYNDYVDEVIRMLVPLIGYKKRKAENYDRHPP